jgi:type II secretory pathway pseudopilin PulG
MTLTEVTVATMITLMVSAAFFTLFSAFSRNVQLEDQRASTLRDIRPVISQMLLELRQATDIDGNGAIIEKLDSSWSSLDLIFYSDRRADIDGPERYRYYLTNCAGGICDFVHEVIPADTGSGPNWTYDNNTPAERTLISNVVASGTSLLVGVSWNTGSELVTTSCGGATRCDFDVVRIDLRIDPTPEVGTLAAIQIKEDVRLRNGKRL